MPVNQLGLGTLFGLVLVSFALFVGAVYGIVRFILTRGAELVERARGRKP